MLLIMLQTENVCTVLIVMMQTVYLYLIYVHTGLVLMVKTVFDVGTVHTPVPITTSSLDNQQQWHQQQQTPLDQQLHVEVPARSHSAASRMVSLHGSHSHDNLL